MPNAVLRSSTPFPGEKDMILLVYTGNAEISVLGAATGTFYELLPDAEQYIDKRDLPSLSKWRGSLSDASFD